MRANRPAIERIIVALTKQKKRILVVALICLAAIVLLLATIPLAEWLLREPEPSYDFVFADPALSEDIEADEAYLALDRGFYYVASEGSYEFKSAITEKNATDYNHAVQLLIRLVRAAKAGDADAYNACFSPEYIAASGRFAAFTQQKIYDICIRRYTLSSGFRVPAGYDEVYVYGLTYKIKDNNGSLRRDMGSDASHEQFITVVVDENNEALIYAVEVRNYIPRS